jgi:hypothetical protein
MCGRLGRCLSRTTSGTVSSGKKPTLAIPEHPEGGLLECSFMQPVPSRDATAEQLLEHGYFQQVLFASTSGRPGSRTVRLDEFWKDEGLECGGVGGGIGGAHGGHQQSG